MSDSLSSPGIQSCLKNHLQYNSVFLTPNIRLASQLRSLMESELARHSLAGSSWRSPIVLPFEIWFEQLRRAALLRGTLQSNHLLSAIEEQVLWHEVASKSKQAATMLAVSSAVVEAQKAYSLVGEWQLDLESNRFSFESFPDSSVFYDWAKEFSSLASSRRLIARADAKIELLEAAVSELQSLVLVGFEKLTPLQLALVEKFAEEPGYQQLALTCDCEQVQVAQAENFDQEVLAAGHWAKTMQRVNPEAHIAIVVKDLVQQKLKVERLLKKVWASDENNSPILDGLYFNVSAGLPLASTAIGQTFVDLLASLHHPVPIEQWQRLLSSPYLLQGPNKAELINYLITAMHFSGEKEFELVELPRLLGVASCTSAARARYCEVARLCIIAGGDSAVA